MHQQVRDVPNGVHVVASTVTSRAVDIDAAIDSLAVDIDAAIDSLAVDIDAAIDSLAVDVDPPAAHAPAAVPLANPSATVVIIIIVRRRPVPADDGEVPAVTTCTEEQQRVVIVVVFSLCSVLARLAVVVEPVLLLLPLRQHQEPRGRRVDRLRRRDPRAAPARRHLLEVRCSTVRRRARSGKLCVCL
jgi:hypothetical protein